MHTILPIQITKSQPTEHNEVFRTPHCDVAGAATRVEATVYLPGVDARGVELLLARQELVLTARRILPVRPNWNSLGLERCSHNYRLRIPTRHRLHASQVRAEFDDGVLRIRIERNGSTQARAA